MMPAANLAAWIATMVVISLTPGAGAVASMSSGASHGWWRGIWTAVGQQLALLFLLTVAAVGLASLLHSLPGAFVVMRALGAFYLAWIGVRLIVVSFRETHLQAPARQVIPNTISGMLWHGFLVNATNPKALLALFIITPRFLDTSLPLPPQYFLMGISMVVIDLIVMSGYTALGAWCLRSLADPSKRKWLDRIFGTLFLIAATVVAFA